MRSLEGTKVVKERKKESVVHVQEIIIAMPIKEELKISLNIFGNCGKF